MASELQRLLEGQEFKALVDGLKTARINTVMARKTTEEDRATALNEYHALESIMSVLVTEVVRDKTAKKTK